MNDKIPVAFVLYDNYPETNESPILMNKEQLIAQAARKAGLTQREVRNALNAVIETMVTAFENDTNIAIAGLGTFQVKKRGKVKKLLPQNGKGPVKGVTGRRTMVDIAERRAIKFNPTRYINREYPPIPPECTKKEKKAE